MSKKKKDMAGHFCFKCFAGRYKTLSVLDEVSGRVTCPICCNKVKRIRHEDKEDSQPESQGFFSDYGL